MPSVVIARRAFSSDGLGCPPLSSSRHFGGYLYLLRLTMRLLRATTAIVSAIATATSSPRRHCRRCYRRDHRAGDRGSGGFLRGFASSLSGAAHRRSRRFGLAAGIVIEAINQPSQTLAEILHVEQRQEIGVPIAMRAAVDLDPAALVIDDPPALRDW